VGRHYEGNEGGGGGRGVWVGPEGWVVKVVVTCLGGWKIFRREQNAVKLKVLEKLKYGRAGWDNRTVFGS